MYDSILFIESKFAAMQLNEKKKTQLHVCKIHHIV